MYKISGGGALKVSGGGAIGSTADSPKPLFDIETDFDYQGSARLPQHTYITSAMAIRYRDVSGNPVVGREPTTSDVPHIILPNATTGLLIEYKMTTSFSTSNVAAALPTWTETRRWADWSNYTLLASGYPAVMGAGAAPSMFQFEQQGSKSVLWYSWCPGYPGDPYSLPNLSCVILDDTEARAAGAGSGVSVSAGNISDLYFFSTTSPDWWKDGTQGITPIPPELQARFGGKKYFTFGTNTSNTGPRGANGIGIWSVPAFPNVTSGFPTALSNILTGAEHLYNTGSVNGLDPWMMHRPPNMYWPGGNTVNASIHYISSGGTYSQIAYNVRPAPLTLNVGDCVYFVGNTLDTINVRMTTPASGGNYVIEYNTGSGWAEPPDLAVYTGGAAAGGGRAMTGTHNVFHCTSITSQPTVPNGAMALDGWWRLRRTVAGSTGGDIYGIYVAHARSVGYTGLGGNRPDSVGGYIEDHADALDAYNADPAAHHGFSFAEYVDGACLIRTNAVEGLLCAGKFGTGPRWYGMSSLWVRSPDTTGTPFHFIDSLYGTDNANGNWNFGTIINYMFSMSVAELEQVHAGTRNGDPSGLNPKKFWRMRDHWDYPVDQVAVANTLNAGEVLDSQQTFGQAMVFDQVNKQVIYLWSRAGGSEPWTMVWNVRDS